MSHVYPLGGSFEAAAAPELAWEVLTDYGRHAEWCTDLRTSVVVARGGGEATVLQEAVGKVALFTKVVKMRLAVREVSPSRLTFTDTLREDFSHYEGTWTFRPVGGGVRVDYAVTCQPRGPVPRFIFGPMMEEAIGRLMGQMRGEIERRAAQRRSA